MQRATRKRASGSLRRSDLLHLLRAYQAVIAGRPLEAGNREFLGSLIRASVQVAEALARAPRRAELDQARLGPLKALLAQQQPETAKESARQALHLLHGLERGTAAETTPALYLPGPLAALPRHYRALHVLFGNGLGLGDQVACYRLVRSLMQRYPGKPVTIYTLYPRLWSALVPGVREVSYRDRPLRPFEELAASDRAGQDLVVVVDFDCFDLHRRVIARWPGRDIVEVSLGRLTAWVRRHGSPWIHFENFAGADIRSYYYFLQAVANRLLALPPGVPWQPRAGLQREPAVPGRVVVLLNPFTSKATSLGPGDWARFAQMVRRVMPPGMELRVMVFPGLDPRTQAFASEICRLVEAHDATVRASTLETGDGKPPSPFSALPLLMQVLTEVDLCLSVDTFTGHLAPLQGVPTIVITPRENREFWVPGPWSYYCLEDRAERALGPLVRHLLTATRPGASLPAKALEAAQALDGATVAASRGGLTVAIMSRLVASIRQIVENPVVEVGYPEQGREWVLLWSRLAAAVAREPPGPEALGVYLYRWTETEFVKLVQLYARCGANW